MTKGKPILIRTEHDRPIHKTADAEFLRALMHGLLLALREQKILNEHQLRIAQDRLSAAR